MGGGKVGGDGWRVEESGGDEEGRVEDRRGLEGKLYCNIVRLISRSAFDAGWGDGGLVKHFLPEGKNNPQAMVGFLIDKEDNIENLIEFWLYRKLL